MIDQNSRKNKVIIILIIMILALAGFSSYQMFFKENGNIKCKDNNTKEKVVDNTSVQNKIEIYGKKYETGAYFICNHQSDSDDCKNVLFSIDTESANANVIHISLPEKQSFQYIIYFDNELKLYNVKDESTKKIDIDINGDILWLYEGFILNGEDEAFYYDLKDNKKIIEKYDYLYPLKDSDDGFYMENPKYLYSKKGNTVSVIDFKTSNIILNLDSSEYDGVNITKDGGYFVVEYNQTEDTKTLIYNTKGEKIVELESNQTYETQGSKLIIYEYTQKKVKEY